MIDISEEIFKIFEEPTMDRQGDEIALLISVTRELQEEVKAMKERARIDYVRLERLAINAFNS